MNEIKEKLQATGIVKGVFFSLGTTPSSDPKFDCAKAIVDLFNQAKKTAHVAIYSLTEPNIVNAMIDAHKRGVEVAIVVDKTESKNSYNTATVKKLSQAGVDIRIATRQTALMHNKVLIVDNSIVATGSGIDVATDYEQYVFQRILKNETPIKPNI